MESPGQSFLRNKKIANVLRDAINSPLGSTKRKAAKNLINVMSRVVSRHNTEQGQGGPGYFGQGGPGTARYSPTTPGSASFMTKAPRKDPDYSNMIIFPSPPGPRRGNPKTKAMIPTKAGEPSGVGVGMGTPQTTANKPAQSNFKHDQPRVDVTSGFSDISGPTKFGGQGGPGDLSSPWTIPSMDTSGGKTYASLSPLSGASSRAPVDYPNLFSSVGNFFSSAYNKGQENITSARQRHNAPIGVLAPTAPKSAAPQPAPTGGNMSVATPANSNIVPWEQQRDTLRSQGAAAGQANAIVEAPAAPVTDTAPQGQQPQPPQPPQVQLGGQAQQSATEVSASLKAGIGANMGATGWAQSTMGDQDLLKQIFPNEPNLPQSASLSEAIGTLSATLKDEYNIKELESQLAQMTASGVVLGPMLQTYIQNKDVSLNSIHDQIQNAQTQMLHSDQGNPYETAIWSRYSDYLNNLYTAQNASYADFFNKSTTMYSDALDAMNNTFTTALNSYTNDLTTGAAATEADYNRIYQALTDMYTAAQDAPIRELNLQILRDQAALAHSELIGAGSGAGQGDWIDQYKKMTDMGVLFDNATGDGGTSNARYGTLMPDVTDIGGAIQTILADNPKVGTDGALYILGQAFQKTLQAAGADPSEAITQASRIQNMVIQGVADGYLPPSSGLSIIQALTPSISRSISDFVTSTPGMENTAKDAMVEALIGSGGWMGIGAKKISSINDFKKKYTTTLGDDLSGAVYMQMQDTKARLEASQSAEGGEGPAGTSPYSNMSMEEINRGFADSINSFSTPQEVGDYLGYLVAPYITGKAIETLNPVDQ